MNEKPRRCISQRIIVACRRHAFDERLQVGRVALAAELVVGAADLPLVDGVLVLVDRRANLAQRPPQFDLTLTLDRDPRQRHHRAGQHQDDGRHDEELDEGESSLLSEPAEHVPLRFPAIAP